MALVERKPGDAASKLYLSGIEIGNSCLVFAQLVVSKLYLSGIEINTAPSVTGALRSPNCTLVELKCRLHSVSHR